MSKGCGGRGGDGGDRGSPTSSRGVGGKSGRWGSSGAGRGRSSQRTVIWAEDQASFKVEQEGMGISDDKVMMWLRDLSSELDETKRSAYCSSMNLSRNELGDYGVKEIVSFLVRRSIPVQLLKLYKNRISDDGVRALGNLIKHESATSEIAVQEIHLSHNLVTEEGAFAIFEAVQESNRYPCRRGKDGSPLWLRMENNQISWEPVFKRLAKRGISWSVGEARDSWRKDEGNAEKICPMVSMHWSYHHQATSVGGSSRAEPERHAERSKECNSHEDEDDEESAAIRSLMQKQLEDASEVQSQKFNLIISILRELQDRQARLESSVRELVHLQQAHQQSQQTPPRMFGNETIVAQQNWSGGQNQFGTGVW